MTTTVQVPISEIPGALYHVARQVGAHTNFLFRTWGGLGDMVCAEPTIRYALDYFDGVDFTLWAEEPDLYAHLLPRFKRVFKVGSEEQPNPAKYLFFWSIKPPESLAWQFMNHMVTHAVDFVSLCMFACQLPVANREIKMPDFPVEDINAGVQAVSKEPRAIVVHAGKHWPSKTFPTEWWQAAVDRLGAKGFIPVLIGQDQGLDDNRGYVPVDGTGCIDLRGKTTLRELIYLLKNARYILTNDSVPVHIGAAGNAHIGFIASCKHPDYITHWRNGRWGWRMKNLGLDGMWNHIHRNPSKQDTRITADTLPDGVMEKLLPSAESVAEYFESVRRNPEL